jgi:hypothetical protein
MLSVYNIVLLQLLLKLWALKLKRKYDAKNEIWKIRNIYYEYKLRERYGSDLPPFDYSRSLLFVIDQITMMNLHMNYDDRLDAIHAKRQHLEQPIQLYDPIDINDIPELRLPKPGIHVLPYRYIEKSPGLAFTATSPIPVQITDPYAAEEPLNRMPETYSVDADLSGLPPHPTIAAIISQWFPAYMEHLDYFCRPPSYGPQAFYDFNRTIDPHPPPSPERDAEILSLCNDILNIKPYQPIHFADTLASGIPLNTSASYHDKNDPDTKIRARVSSPAVYARKPKSKGYSINVTLGNGRTQIHNIKEDGTPMGIPLSDCLIKDSDGQSRLQHFFLSQPSELFIRTQISKRDPQETKKIRPVYAVAILFILIEIMLTYCLLTQLRNPECAVMHGLETFRGGMKIINLVAHHFDAYVSLDWSQFDQRLPIYVIIAYYTRFLPSKIIVSRGYASTHWYPDSRLKTMDRFATKIFNLLQFLLLWYINMVFISYDGYAYVRLLGGVPSGLLNTQALDSFGNLYIILDCMLEFGFTRNEITNMIFFIMGDDNIFFARCHFTRIVDFMTFLDQYAKTRHGMVLSVLKSVWTTLRSKIEVLGYTNNDGLPTRSIGKLVAQLAYPERPIPSAKNWMHAARALGLAYASCGQDSSFHMLCYMVYNNFKPLPEQHVSTREFARVVNQPIQELLGFSVDDEKIKFPDFPSLVEVRDIVSYYHGYFHETDKWKTTIFQNPPSTTDPDVVTLADWLSAHPEFQFQTDNIWI